MLLFSRTERVCRKTQNQRAFIDACAGIGYSRLPFCAARVLKGMLMQWSRSVFVLACALLTLINIARAQTPTADIAVTASATPAQVAPGETQTYRFVVTNRGPGLARSVGVTTNLLAQGFVAQSTVVQFSSNALSVTGPTERLTFDVNNLPSGESATAIFTGVFNTAGDRNLEVRTTNLSALYTDADATNNTAALAVTVGTSNPQPNQVAAMELEDWSTGAAVIVGRASFDLPLQDLVWDDADMSSEMGVVAVRGVGQALTFRGFEFGAIHLRSPIAGAGRTPLEQVLVGAKPAGRWATYPYADTFNAATDLTIPPPFKVRLLNAAGATVYTFQMQDGLPINSPSLSQARTETQPVRPFFNIGMLLPWQSSLPRANVKAAQLMPTFNDHAESKSKLHYSVNGAIPLLGEGANGRSQINGVNHWYQMPRWPRGYGPLVESNSDPFAYNVNSVYTGDTTGARSAWATGWDYEPGSISGHDWLTGPGGGRHDRAVVPVPLALWASNQNYRRLNGDVPIRDMVNAWGFAYFNHSGHYLRDVQRFTQIMSTDTERNTHSHFNGYYGRGPFTDLSGSIDMRGIVNGDYNLVGNNGGTPLQFYLDRNGNRFWGGWLTDDQHLHQTPYWHAIALNSPMHLLASRAAFNQSFLSQLGGRSITMRNVADWSAGPSYSNVNSRVQAYRWMHYTLMWKLGTSNPLGLSQAEVERIFLEDLRTWHDNILVPLQNEPGTNPYHVAIKRLGIGVLAGQDGTGKWFLYAEDSALRYYHAGLFLSMKKLGLWDKLRLDTKAKATLDAVAASMNRFSMDFILDTDGRAENESSSPTVAGPFDRFEDITAASVPTSWADWATKNPTTPEQDWIRTNNGTAGGVLRERSHGQHMRAQWAIMVRDWFPELATAATGGARAAQAAAKYEDFYAQWKQNVDSKATPAEKRSADWGFQAIHSAPFRAP
jgi:hypothetical protein